MRERLPAAHWIDLLDEGLYQVHRFIEERGLRFALLGSSARKLRAAGVNRAYVQLYLREEIGP